MLILRAVRTNLITQGFGPEKTKASAMPIYKSYGLLAHNGLDFLCKHGESVYFDCSGKGIVEKIEADNSGGIGVCVITNDADGDFRHIYWHFLEGGIKVQAGQTIETGDLLGLGDNTGTSTGDHLHRGMKKVVKDLYGNWLTADYTEDYKGAIDPTAYFKNIFVLDYIATLEEKISLLKKAIEIAKKLLGLKKN
jgi:murein DD-endopeptidase MepM/ murein hydrolase activator NlpD